MKQHDLFVLLNSYSYDDYKINYLNSLPAMLEDNSENRQFEKDFRFYQEIASKIFEGGIKESYIDVRVKYDHNTEFDFLFACKVNSKKCLVNIELTQNNDLKYGKKIDQLKRHNKYLSQFYSQYNYNIITILVNKINDCKIYYLLDNDKLQEFNLGQTKYEVEWDSNFKLEDTTVINDFQCEWLTHEQYNTFKEIEKLDSSIKYVWLEGNAGCGKTAIGLKVYRKNNSKTILLKCAEVSKEEQEKGIVNFTTFINKNKGKIKQHYDFLIVDECQSIVEKQLDFIKENISNFHHIIFIGDEYQNYLQTPFWEKYLKEISSTEKQFKRIVLKEYLRQNEDTISFFKYLCFDQKPKNGVMYPKFKISRNLFTNLPTFKHPWNNNKYNKEVRIGTAIGKTYKNAQVIIGEEFKAKKTMNHLYTHLTRTPCPIVHFDDEDAYNWFIDKYNNYTQQLQTNSNSFAKNV